MQKILIAWLPIGIASTLILGTVYATVQQNYRQSANDPQIQLADDGIGLLLEGIPFQQLAGGMPRIDIRKSLATFVMFFDESGKEILSSGYIGATGTTTAVLPKGVLDDTRKMGENRLTWEIPTGERFATVIRHWGTKNAPSGFLLVARSLREVEKRELQLEVMVAIAWVITMIITIAAVWGKQHLRSTYESR